jgi:hypothetical protein
MVSMKDLNSALSWDSPKAWS